MFEGRDTAGKGGTIKRITERVSPRVFRVVALPAPTEREKSQMYLQRYVAHFPAAGEVIIFDRSWYNRAGVERVMGFTPMDHVEKFLDQAPTFEKAMVDSGILLIKYWLEVGPDEQTRRLEGRINDPRKIWKLSDMDLKSYSRWFDYSRARDDMLRDTDTSWAPWYVAHTDDKKRGRLNIISHLLSLIPYEPLTLPDIDAAQAPEGRRVRRPAAAAAVRPGEVLIAVRHALSPLRPIDEGPTMTATAPVGTPPTNNVRWYALPPEEVAERLGVDAVGRPARGDRRPAADPERAERAARGEAAARAGGGSWPSTPPTCRSSW